MDGDWITLGTLGNLSGVVFAVTIVSQFLKGILDRAVKMPTRLMVLLISWIVLLGYRYAITGALHFDGLFLDILNGFVVSLTAMGAHTLARERLGWK